MVYKNSVSCINRWCCFLIYRESPKLVEYFREKCFSVKLEWGIIWIKPEKILQNPLWSTSLVSLIKLNEETYVHPLSYFWWAIALTLSFLRPGWSDTYCTVGVARIKSPWQKPRCLPVCGLCSTQKAVLVFIFKTICVGDSMEQEGIKPKASPPCVFCAAAQRIWLQILPLPCTGYLILANCLTSPTSVSLPEKPKLVSIWHRILWG